MGNRECYSWVMALMTTQAEAEDETLILTLNGLSILLALLLLLLLLRRLQTKIQ